MIEFLSKAVIDGYVKPLRQKLSNKLVLEHTVLNTLHRLLFCVDFTDPIRLERGTVERYNYRIVTFPDGIPTNLVLTIYKDNSKWVSNVIVEHSRAYKHTQEKQHGARNKKSVQCGCDAPDNQRAQPSAKRSKSEEGNK